MDKEKEIEQIARAMCEHLEPCMQDKTCTSCRTYKINCYTIHKATLLVEAGYGNKKQVIKKFAERLKEELNYKIEEEFGDNSDSTKYITLDIDETEVTIENLVEEFCEEE